MLRFTTFAIAFSLLACPAAFANSSAYTKLKQQDCTTTTQDEAGANSTCPGFGDYPLYIKDGDLRIAVTYGPALQVIIDRSFESFSSFNNINETTEWRLNNKGLPFAAIQRWYIENDPSGDGTSSRSRGQVLVISRVAQPEDGLSCVVGYVDALANANANALSRTVADNEARDFACGYSEPMWWGERGEKSGEPMRYLPDELKIE